MDENRLHFDLQVNGYAGVDFNADALSDEQMHAACQRLAADGVGGILATIITDHVDRMAARLAKIAAIRRRDPLAERMVAGVHIEGPFISRDPGYIGTHPPGAIRPADPDVMKRLLDAAEGLTRIVTLAPEMDRDLRVTRLLARSGIVVAAGHCDSSTDQLRAAIDAGLAMFTHLGNGCPMVLPRHDNIVQRVLALADHLWISFIADGAHVAFVALGNYLRLIPPENVVIVTDAISAAGCAPGNYMIGGRPAVVGDDLVPRAPDKSHLVGSACTLPRMAENLRRHLGADEARIHQWMAENPRRLVGLASPRR